VTEIEFIRKLTKEGILKQIGVNCHYMIVGTGLTLKSEYGDDWQIITYRYNFVLREMKMPLEQLWYSVVNELDHLAEVGRKIEYNFSQTPDF
jgi:DNA-binding Lrp family transcriptional regulator